MCYTAFRKDNGDIFPCGKCPKCISRRADAWAFRLQQHEKQSTSSHFITLTYDTQHLPINSNGVATLNKRHLDLFFKSLRKAHSQETRIKYYAVGEYGTKNDRPHYHIIIFNAHIEKIQPCWIHGQVHYGDVEPASVKYTLKYLQKTTKKQAIDHYRQKTFSTMSKKLGLAYLSNSMVLWHNNDELNRQYCHTHDGKKITLPRYYKQKLYSKTQMEKIANHNQIIQSQKNYEYFIKDGYKPDKKKAVKAAYERMYLNHNQNRKL